MKKGTPKSLEDPCVSPFSIAIAVNSWGLPAWQPAHSDHRHHDLQVIPAHSLEAGEPSSHEASVPSPSRGLPTAEPLTSSREAGG